MSGEKRRVNNHCQFVREWGTTKSIRQVMGSRRAYPSPQKGNRLPIFLMTKRTERKERE